MRDSRDDFDPYEGLLMRCGLSIDDQVQLFGKRLNEVSRDVEEGEVEVLLNWLRESGRIDEAQFEEAEAELKALISEEE